jgi:hypothetical protein
MAIFVDTCTSAPVIARRPKPPTVEVSTVSGLAITVVIVVNQPGLPPFIVQFRPAVAKILANLMQAK